jgi:hypothetical protein
LHRFRWICAAFSTWISVSFGKIEFKFGTLYIHCISKLQFEVPAVVTYKTLKSEKDKGISTLQAEKEFCVEPA